MLMRRVPGERINFGFNDDHTVSEMLQFNNGPLSGARGCLAPTRWPA